MTFGSILYALLIQPLQIIFEVIYNAAFSLIENRGITIIVLSLAINFLVLPLYKRADVMQREERDLEMKLQDGVAHIKKTFKGDERMMMLQTYYRQNNYKPLYVLKGATSLLLQIPFFIAAYRFLSTMQELQGVKFGIINDLSKADGLITIAGVSINILPIIMTAINFVSSAIYSKDYPKKTKIQLYAMALFFLVFLYKSPSGLVFYWTLNNAFSLLKTLVFKSKNPKKLTYILFSISGIILFILGLIFKVQIDEDKLILLIYLAFVLQVPILIYLILNKSKNKKEKKQKVLKEYTTNKKLFFAAGGFMSLLVGCVIPSSVIKASPQEFVFSDYFVHPLWYVVSAFCIAFGTFVIWLGVFYWLSSNKGKVVFEKVMAIISVVSVIDYMFFAKNVGTLTSNLTYIGSGFEVVNSEIYINIAIFAAIIFIFIKFFKYFKKQLPFILIICIFAFGVMSTTNVVNISQSIAKLDTTQSTNENFTINLSKTKKNVVVIMLDRALGDYIPYIFNEKPELKEQYDGFTYYDNTISYGRHTNLAAPALFGGYEYTPIEMNTKSSQSLEEKQNEAIKVMPAIFSKNNYDVTVVNPIYANYQWKSDLSIYDDLENVKAYNVDDLMEDNSLNEKSVTANRRNFYMYSIMKCCPCYFQSLVYNSGRYFSTNTIQTASSSHKTSGNLTRFLEYFSILQNLNKVTKTTDSDKGQVLIMANEATHETEILQEPDYLPSDSVDNTEYDSNNKSRFTLNGKTIEVEDYYQYAHYESDMAAFIQVGKWLDYLKELGVYDNTKIILVSDHGCSENLNQLKDLIYEDGIKGGNDMASYFPLLMVKDYNATGFTTSSEFMTNADVPTIAFEDTVENPVNPYTNKKIDSSEKTAHDQYIIASDNYDILKNNGNQFTAAGWYSIHDSIWDKNNWSVVAKNKVLTNKDIK